MDEIRKELAKYGNDAIFLFDDNYGLIYDLIWLKISNKEISDGRILKKEHDKQERNQKEIQIAKDLIEEL